MTTTLTDRQRDIYDFIVERVRERGIPPSLTEIARAFGLASASGVADHLNAIERKGYIRRQPGISRGIELLARPGRAPRRRVDASTAVRVPVIGSVPAKRRLSSARTARRHLFFDGRIAPGKAVALRFNVSGLEERGILKGDYLVVVRGMPARSGELAVAQSATGTTLVEVLSGRNGVRRVEDRRELDKGFEVLGKVVAVLRSMDAS